MQWQVHLSAKQTLFQLKGELFLQKSGQSSIAITKSDALDLIEQEACLQRDLTIERLKDCDDSEKIEFILAVKFALLRRLRKLSKQLQQP